MTRARRLRLIRFCSIVRIASWLARNMVRMRLDISSERIGSRILHINFEDDVALI